MAKDMETADEQSTNDGADNRDDDAGQRDESPAKLSIRESIQDGIDKAREKDSGDDSSKKSDLESSERSEKTKRKESKRSDDENLERTKKESKQARSNDSEPDGESDSESDSSEQTEEKPKIATKAPVGWTKEAKAKWNDLPPEIQDSVLKREKEVSDGFAGTKQATERLQKLDAVIQPRLQAIQQFGVTPEQTINKLFEWMEVLSHQNDGVRYQGFKTLADNFKIDLSRFAPQQQTQTGDQTTTTNTQQQSAQDTNPPVWAQSLIERQQQLDQQIANQRQSAAKDYVTNWAKDKPHYEKVKEVMYGLVTSGAVPPTADGNVDLDKAYDKAIRMDDDIWETIQSEKQEAKQLEANEVAAKKKAEVEKARKAGSSIRPSAPTGNLNGSRAQTAKPKNNASVSDSIRAAVRELNEQ